MFAKRCVRVLLHSSLVKRFSMLLTGFIVTWVTHCVKHVTLKKSTPWYLVFPCDFIFFSISLRKASCSYLLSRNLLFCYGGCMFILTKLGLLSDRFATIFCIDILISQKKISTSISLLPRSLSLLPAGAWAGEKEFQRYCFSFTHWEVRLNGQFPTRRIKLLTKLIS